MLKKFFISMLGTMAGFWISLVLLFVFGAVAVGVAIGSSSPDTAMKVKKNSILYFDLSGEVVERYSSQPFLQMIQSYDKETLALNDMVQALHSAQFDNRIEAVYLRCGGAYMAPASREEVLEAIASFKFSGKPVIAYGDAYTQGDYMLAAMADSIYLNPMGAIDIHGVGGATPFFTGLLDKLGIKMQIVKVGTFKSAVEPYILTSMSGPARMQMQQYCDSIWAAVAGAIATSRNIPVDSIYSIAPRFTVTWPAASFVENGLATALKYNREVEDILRKISGLKDSDELRLVSPSDYLASPESFVFWREGRAYRSLLCRRRYCRQRSRGIVGPTVVNDIVKLADNDDVKGLVLRVNSPGGSALASDVIWREMELLKAEKPVVVSMGSYAASGGYYISAPADVIVADRMTLTGSIGVFGMFLDYSGALKNKLGITVDGVQSNASAGMGEFKPLTPAERACIMRGVDKVYDTFTSYVAKGRNLPIEKVLDIAGGRVWSGEDALGIGLIDTYGGLKTAIAVAADKAGLGEEYRVVEKIRQPTGFAAFIAALDAKVRAAVAASGAGIAVEDYGRIRKALGRQGIVMYSPYCVELQ